MNGQKRVLFKLDLYKKKFLVELLTDCQVSHFFDYSRLKSNLTRAKGGHLPSF